MCVMWIFLVKSLSLISIVCILKNLFQTLFMLILKCNVADFTFILNLYKGTWYIPVLLFTLDCNLILVIAKFTAGLDVYYKKVGFFTPHGVKIKSVRHE